MVLIGAVGSFFVWKSFPFLQKRVKLPLVNLNQHITCKLCNGYLIDAATITECLHTCKSTNLHDFPIDLVWVIDWGILARDSSCRFCEHKLGLHSFSKVAKHSLTHSLPHSTSSSQPVLSFGLRFVPCYTHLLQLFPEHHCSPPGGFNWLAPLFLLSFGVHLMAALWIISGRLSQGQHHACI